MSFDLFWSLYPRRCAKKDALKAWGKLTPEQQQTAIDVLPAWRSVWANTVERFIPHPATWLNGWRFDDELPVQRITAKTQRENVVAAFTSYPSRIEAHDESVLPALRIVRK